MRVMKCNNFTFPTFISVFPADTSFNIIATAFSVEMAITVGMLNDNLAKQINRPVNLVHKALKQSLIFAI